jgi:hypothetical protein
VEVSQEATHRKETIMIANTIPRHSGLERVLRSAAASKRALAELSRAKMTRKLFVAAGVVAAITLAERTLDVSESGFLVEWLVLNIVALAALWVMASIVVPALRVARYWVRTWRTRAHAKSLDENFYNAALADPRIMNDLLMALDRSEWLVDESDLRSRRIAAMPAPWHSLLRHM